MIGKLTGILSDKNPPQVIVDCNGVGYEVQVPMSTFYNLPASGQRVTLLTHFVVREDAQILYGFATHAERGRSQGWRSTEAGRHWEIKLIKLSCCARLNIAIFAIPAIGIFPWFVAPLAGLGAIVALPALKIVAAPRPAAPPAGYPLWPLWHVGEAFLASRPAMGALLVGLVVGAILGR
jgi:hypothetical protein